MSHGKRFCDLIFIKDKDKVCIIWNNAKYRPTEAIDPTRIQRWKCIANCNSAIYVLNDKLINVKRHDDYDGMNHSHCYHKRYGNLSLIQHQAIKSMKREIQLGKTLSTAYDDYASFCIHNQTFVL